MPEETLEEAAERLVIVVADLARRYSGDTCVSPIAAPNGISAARLILDKLEAALQGSKEP